MTYTQGNDTEQLKRLTEEWIAALLNGDANTLRQMTAESFVTIGPRGFLLNKAQWLESFKPVNLTYESLEWDEISVWTFGKTALVSGHDQQKVRYQGNPPIGMDLRALLVFVKQQGHWQLVSQQYSPIVANVP